MGSQLSTEEALKVIRDNGFLLPDISVDPTLQHYLFLEEDTSAGAIDHMIPKMMKIGVNEVGKLAAGVPALAPIMLFVNIALPLLTLMIDTSFSKANPQDEREQFRSLLVEEKLTQLRDLNEEFINYCDRYADNEEKLMKEIQIFERKQSTHLLRVRNAFLDGHITSRGIKVWVNGAMFHMGTLQLLGLQGRESQTSIITAIKIYQKQWEELIDHYKIYKKRTIEVSGSAVTDREQGKSVAVRSNLTIDEVFNSIFKNDNQISNTNNAFQTMLQKAQISPYMDPSQENSSQLGMIIFYVLLFVILILISFFWFIGSLISASTSLRCLYPHAARSTIYIHS